MIALEVAAAEPAVSLDLWNADAARDAHGCAVVGPRLIDAAEPRARVGLRAAQPRLVVAGLQLCRQRLALDRELLGLRWLSELQHHGREVVEADHL